MIRKQPLAFFMFIGVIVIYNCDGPEGPIGLTGETGAPGNTDTVFETLAATPLIKET